MRTLTAVFSVLVIIQIVFADDSPFVKIPQGQLKGKYLSTRNGKTISGFLGIPFAAPPLAKLRFKDPEPAGSWGKTRDATRYGNPCPQRSFLGKASNPNVTIGNEDCLYLNVYTPKVRSDSYLPVMVFIHGGGFFLGYGEAFSTPEYLMDKDIVFVSTNYRLGVLGFLSTEDDVAPGNYGMKDQVAALRWIKDNIKYFGGNPDSVTIFGESAGGASVSLHLMSPLSKGLFHAAISQSGTAHCVWATVPSGTYKKYSKIVAEAVGCPYDSSDSLIECLRAIPAEQFTKFIFEFNELGIISNEMFRPRVEGHREGAFLTEYPSDQVTSVPWMVGVNSDEGLLRVTRMAENEGLDKMLSNINQNFERVMEITLLLLDKTENPKQMMKEVREFYFGDRKVNRNTLKDLINLYTDQMFLYCTAKSLRLHRGPAYYYYFSYKGSHSLSAEFLSKENYSGVGHADEMIYLFPLELFISNRTTNENDLKLSHQMVELWTNFAIYRTPTPKKTFAFWEPIASPDLEYLHIDNDGFEMKKNLLKEREDFWRSQPIVDDLKPARLSKSKREKTEL